MQCSEFFKPPLSCFFFRSGEVVQRQPADSGGEGRATGRTGGQCEGAAAGDQPQGHRLQHLSVLGSKVAYRGSN